MVTWEMDTRGFADFTAELSRLSGRDYDSVLVNQTGRVLENAVAATPVRDAATITRSVRFKNRNLRTVPWGDSKRGEPVIVGKRDGTILFVDESNARSGVQTGKKVGTKTFHDMNGFFHWSNERWARYQAALALLREKEIDEGKARGARGLAKHSWYQIAQDLAIDIDVPGYVRNARPSNGREYQNGTAHKLLEGAAYYIEISNNFPALANPSVSHRKIDGRAILQRAIDRRLTAFQIEMAHGVFSDLKTRAQRYPGIFVAMPGG